jgi:hypothetical protein
MPTRGGGHNKLIGIIIIVFALVVAAGLVLLAINTFF